MTESKPRRDMPRWVAAMLDFDIESDGPGPSADPEASARRGSIRRLVVGSLLGGVGLVIGDVSSFLAGVVVLAAPGVFWLASQLRVSPYAFAGVGALALAISPDANIERWLLVRSGLQMITVMLLLDWSDEWFDARRQRTEPPRASGTADEGGRPPR